jgi:hypothetical protein
MHAKLAKFDRTIGDHLMTLKTFIDDKFRKYIYLDASKPQVFMSTLCLFFSDGSSF